MEKHIRPLASFKKMNPRIYTLICSAFAEKTGLSAKQKENEFYWNYCYFDSGLNDFTQKWTEFNIPGHVNSFFWKDGNTANNKEIISEMGRLLLAGWNYNIEDFTKQICKYVFSAYQRTDAVNDNIFVEAINHVRENICYYNANELKMKGYLLEKLFPAEMKTLLPKPPKALEEFNEIMDMFRGWKTENLKKDPDHYYKLSQQMVEYSEYLQEILNSYHIPYMTKEELRIENDKEGSGYFDEVDKATAEYEVMKEAAYSGITLLT